MADIKTLIEVLKILKNVSFHCYMLESVEEQEKWGRYTFLGFEPTMEITCVDGKMSVKGERTLEENTHHPKELIRKIFEEYRSPKIDGLPC